MAKKGLKTMDDLEQNIDELNDEEKLIMKMFMDLKKEATLEIASKTTDKVKEILDKLVGDGNYNCELVGSYRRGQDTCDGVDIIIGITNGINH